MLAIARNILILFSAGFIFLLVGCGTSNEEIYATAKAKQKTFTQTATSVPPTATSVPPTDTPLPTATPTPMIYIDRASEQLLDLNELEENIIEVPRIAW